MAKQKKEPKPVSKSPSNSKPWLMDKKLYALIVFVFGFALYANTLFNDYNLDDELVTRNHQVTSKGWNVLKFNFDAFNSVELQDSSFSQKLKYFMPVIFRVPYYQDNAGFKYEYRPIVFASFALEHALFSKKDMINGSEVETDSAAISHFINILLYSLLCTLLFFILCNLFKTYNIIFPFIICLMFTAYPMHTEVVASIKNRDEILALIFGLLSLKFSLDYAENNKVISLLWVLVFFLSGILSKPTTISFALLIPLCIIFFKNVSYLKLMLLTAVFAFPSVFYSRLYSAFQQVALAFVLFAAVTGLYLFKNRGFFGTEIKNIFATIPKYFKSTANSQPTEGNHLDLHSLKTPSAILLFIFGVLIPVAIAAGGIYLHNAVLTCAPLVLVGVLYSFVNDELKLAFTTPLTLITLLAICTFFHNQTKLIETALIVFFASQIFSGQKYFRTVGLINYLIFSVVSIIWLHSIQFVFILFFIGFLNRKLFNLTLVLVAVSVLLFARKTLALFHGHSNLNAKAMMFPIYISVMETKMETSYKHCSVNYSPGVNILFCLGSSRRIQQRLSCCARSIP